MLSWIMALLVSMCLRTSNNSCHKRSDFPLTLSQLKAATQALAGHHSKPPHPGTATHPLLPSLQLAIHQPIMLLYHLHVLTASCHQKVSTTISPGNNQVGLAMEASYSFSVSCLLSAVGLSMCTPPRRWLPILRELIHHLCLLIASPGVVDSHESVLDMCFLPHVATEQTRTQLGGSI